VEKWVLLWKAKKSIAHPGGKHMNEMGLKKSENRGNPKRNQQIERKKSGIFWRNT